MKNNVQKQLFCCSRSASNRNAWILSANHNDCGLLVNCFIFVCVAYLLLSQVCMVPRAHNQMSIDAGFIKIKKLRMELRLLELLWLAESLLLALKERNKTTTTKTTDHWLWEQIMRERWEMIGWKTFVNVNWLHLADELIRHEHVQLK